MTMKRGDFKVLIGDYAGLRERILAYFDYVEDWRVLPIDDRTGMTWHLRGEGPGAVEYTDENGVEFEDEIYTQRHLPKWVYRGADYTMVLVDTHVDGNQFLAIFDNALEDAQP